jgi:AraC-like DNA-binding protein
VLVEKVDQVLSRVSWAARESRTSTSYFWNNFHRYHLNQLVIQWTSSGFGFFRDERGRHLVAAGHAMLFTYDEASSYGYPEEATEPYEFIALNLSPSRTLQPLFEEVRLRFGSVFKMALHSPAAVGLHDIFQRHQTGSFRDPLQESELILRLFHSLYREQQAVVLAKDAIEFGYHFIRDHFHSPLNLKTLAAKCGVSREHFIREFRLRYLASPGTMLRTLRLQHGRTLLLSTRSSVSVIAGACGFLSSGSFCRAYRQQFGCSPRQARLEQ